MVRHRLRSLSDLIRNDYRLRVVCRCGHVAFLNPQTLLMQHRIAMLDDLEGKLKCSICANRDCDYSACFSED